MINNILKTSHQEAGLIRLSLDSSEVNTHKSTIEIALMASPIDQTLRKASWKSKSPWRVNIAIWTLSFGLLNCSTVLHKKSTLLKVETKNEHNFTREKNHGANNFIIF